MIVVMGGWALVLCLMVYWSAKYKAETRELEKESPPPRRPDYVAVDGPEIDLSGDDDADAPPPRPFGDNDNEHVIFEHI